MTTITAPVIGFAGLSHLGIISSAAAAAKGFDVVGYDPDAQLCAALAAGRPPLFEPGLPELLAAHRDRLRFTVDPAALRDCSVIYLAHDVPTDDAGRGDLAPLGRLSDEILPSASSDATLVVLSQVPPGYTRALAGRIAALGVDRAPAVFYQVETLIFGRAVERALGPERLIVGCSDPRAPLPGPYAAFLAAFDCPRLPMRYESAELTKIAINMCLVSSIATANTLAEVCEAIGADWAEMVPALRLDRRIGPYAYLDAGLGIAGGNLERDLATVRALADEWGTDAAVVDAWLANSQHRRDWALKVIYAEVLALVAEPTIAVWGLAYKPDTASVKNSPALALIGWLRRFAVRVYDPQACLDADMASHVVQVASALEACRGVDVLVIMTPWQEFAAADLARVRGAMAGRVIVDPYGVVDRERCVELGFAHFRLGAPSATTLKEQSA